MLSSAEFHMREVSVALVAAGLLASLACSKAPPPPSSAKPADPRIETSLRGFASAIVARDYAAAYGAIASERRGSLPMAEFQEAFGHYRDGLPDDLKAEVIVEAYDRESATLLPEEFRDRIAAEGVVHFEPTDQAIEGFSAHVWVLLEAGEPRLAHFYVED